MCTELNIKKKCQHKGKKIRKHKAWLFTVEEIAIICKNCGKELRTEHYV